MTSVLAAYFKTTRVQIAALLHFLIAGALTQVPLFNYLGYEFSAMMTIPATLISGILTLQFLSEHRIKPITRRTWLFVIVDYLHVNFLLLLIPLIVITLNAFVVKNCAYSKGLAYYLLLPLVTMIFSVSLSLVIGSLFRWSKTIFIVTVFGLLSHIVVITYFQPQLYAYNFILGYFPGITYDETIGDMQTLIIFRQFTLIASLLLILIFVVGLSVFGPRDPLLRNISSLRSTIRQHKVLWVCIALTSATLVAGHLYRSEIGIAHSGSDIQRALGRRSESENFIFYYAPDNYSISEIIRLKAEAEYHFRVASLRLESGNGDQKKIEVYIYPSSSVKQRYIGTANEGSFRHELVHILAAEFGFPIIRASTRMALNEGVAVAIDWEPGLFTPHQYAAALMREKSLENVASMFSLTGFAAQPSSYAYLVTGSFCKYLIDRYGIDRVKHAFPNGNILTVFGENLESLVKDWKIFLRTVDATEIPAETVKAYFFTQSIFYRTCAREVAEKNQRAVQALRVKEYRSAEMEFMASYEDAPTSYALRGIMQSLIAQKKYSEAIALYDDLPETSLLRLNPSLLFLSADASFLYEKKERAFLLYSKLSQMNFSEGFIEAAALRRQLIREQVEPGTVYSLYYSGMEDSAKVVTLKKEVLNRKESIALRYLLGTILWRMGENEQAIAYFHEVMAGVPNDSELLYFATTSAAEIEYRLGHYERAKQHFWSAKNVVLTGSLDEYLNERIELCDAVSLAD
ncbi:MAG: hypothetical protein HYV29_07485 [Ignavibacteriales bacterium]|nr:hypothetical protein [Ignavibacteriales bacterium]